MFLFVFSAIVMFVILGGKEQDFVDAADKLIGAGQDILHWSFPKLAEGNMPPPQAEVIPGGAVNTGGGTAEL